VALRFLENPCQNRTHRGRPSFDVLHDLLRVHRHQLDFTLSQQQMNRFRAGWKIIMTRCFGLLVHVQPFNTCQVYANDIFN